MATAKTLVLLSGLVLLWAGAHLAEAQDAAGLQDWARQGPSLTETLKVIECEEICESTRVHPALYFRVRRTRIGPSSCLQSAQDAVRKAGLIHVTSDAFGGGGTAGTRPRRRHLRDASRCGSVRRSSLFPSAFSGDLPLVADGTQFGASFAGRETGLAVFQDLLGQPGEEQVNGSVRHRRRVVRNPDGEPLKPRRTGC